MSRRRRRIPLALWVSSGALSLWLVGTLARGEMIGAGGSSVEPAPEALIRHLDRAWPLLSIALLAVFGVALAALVVELGREARRRERGESIRYSWKNRVRARRRRRRRRSRPPEDESGASERL